MPASTSNLPNEIRHILLTDWDPSNAARFESAHGEYDAYIPPLQDLLLSDPTEEQIIDFLHERERESMCFPPCGRSHLRRIARKLLALTQHPHPAPK